MFRNVDKNMLKSAFVMSGLFTILICITVYEIASEPYLIYDLGKVLKNGNLTPVKLTFGLFLPVLFLTLVVTLFSIAYYKIESGDDLEGKKIVKRKKRRKKEIK